MKRLFVNFMTCAAMATALTLAACSSDSDGEGNGNGNGGNGEGTGSSIVVGDNILSGTLTGEQTLESKEYILNGTVIVADGGRLNIPAGTTIKAREGFSSYLLVAQGGKLYADGTADKPVIFTANTTSPVSGYWGGIIINGKAPISGQSADKSDTGLTEIDNSFKYGGNVDDDNSGSLTYVQICYAGARSTADTKHKAVPTFALPTTAGTAAEVTINYVIIDEDARKKMVCVDPNDIPAVAIVDPELMYSMPKGLTAATGMDALTHAIESYITPGAWVMSDMFELKAIEMIAQNLKAAVDNGKDVAAREAMSQAQYIAGMGFSNVGLGIVHSMAHPLGAFYDTPHGVANALLLPYVMEYNAESPAAPKYIHIAKAMGVDTTGMSEAEGVKAAVEAVKALSASINIPQKLHEINVKEEDIPALAVAAFNDVCTGGNPRPTSVADIEALYRKAF